VTDEGLGALKPLTFLTRLVMMVCSGIEGEGLARGDHNINQVK
jgi:hypothetical protein